TNDLWILSGNGNGTFAAPAIYATESGPTQVAIGDFNGDGRADLAVTNHDSNSVSLLLAFCADLTIAKSHTGNFTQGQSGATFKITVGSTGTESTKGTIP